MDSIKSAQTSGQTAPASPYTPPASLDPVEADKKRKRRLGLIIGLSVGIPVLVITALILVFIYSPQIIGMTENANAAVTNADARSIATGVNAYNALNPDADPIDTKEELAAAAADGSAGVLGPFWPESVTDVDAALQLIEFENSVATVITPAD